jgi:hypothetical protein
MYLACILLAGSPRFVHSKQIFWLMPRLTGWHRPSHALRPSLDYFLVKSYVDYVDWPPGTDAHLMFSKEGSDCAAYFLYMLDPSRKDDAAVRGIARLLLDKMEALRDLQQGITLSSKQRVLGTSISPQEFQLVGFSSEEASVLAARTVQLNGGSTHLPNLLGSKVAQTLKPVDFFWISALSHEYTILKNEGRALEAEKLYNETWNHYGSCAKQCVLLRRRFVP